jgi:hypothetical protein
VAVERKWWPDSILGRFVVGLVLAWIALIAISLLAFVAQRAISPSEGSEGSSGITVETQVTTPTETLP